MEIHPEPNRSLDVLLSAPAVARHTAVELKYLTAGWHGEVEGERFVLKNHGAQDVRAYDVVKDVERVERFIAGRPGWNGLVLVLTNDPNYWTVPKHGRATNAQAFRLYHGNILQGVRAWGARTGAGTMSGREAQLTLAGRYVCDWRDFAELSGPRGTFRLLYFAVPASAQADRNQPAIRDDLRTTTQ